MPYSSSWGRGIFVGRTKQVRDGSYTPLFRIPLPLLFAKHFPRGLILYSYFTDSSPYRLLAFLVLTGETITHNNQRKRTDPNSQQ